MQGNYLYGPGNSDLLTNGPLNSGFLSGQLAPQVALLRVRGLLVHCTVTTWSDVHMVRVQLFSLVNTIISIPAAGVPPAIPQLSRTGELPGARQGLI